ncbi:response regulator transcription factor [Shewanella olleyana]|uniref:response regulator transcription factor n=1 Tax=Shewanella olleyana TaxID=135626 RepID=UPI00200F65AC|nr:response regulator transcription factor [Shewanella olleyana]MCL1066312.1 response regulator transcription factor [Shewanella olleyana]
MPTHNCLTFLIIEPNPILADSLLGIFHSHYSNAKVLTATTVHEARQATKNNKIDLMMIEPEIDKNEGFNLIANFSKFTSNTKILCYSDLKLPKATTLLQQLGSHGLISKQTNKIEIVNAINFLLSGFTLFKLESGTEHVSLSKRESLVFCYLCKGMTNKQISHKLFLSEKTISTYKTRLLKKMNTDSFISLITHNGYLNTDFTSSILV